ncbi:uncharacterized protein [Canis lupus baileyi]|uniref:uncharacterized protein isoform X2 n=1 Tax=Canis lupus baileyi TaxID=143281 RepID=UPI003B96CD7F
MAAPPRPPPSDSIVTAAALEVAELTSRAPSVSVPLTLPVRPRSPQCNSRTSNEWLPLGREVGAGGPKWLPASDHHIRQRRSHPCGQRGEQFQVCWKQEPSCQLYTGTLMPRRQETGHVATSDTPGLPWEGRGVDVEPATGRIHRETRVTHGPHRWRRSRPHALPGCSWVGTGQSSPEAGSHGRKGRGWVGPATTRPPRHPVEESEPRCVQTPEQHRPQDANPRPPWQPGRWANPTVPTLSPRRSVWGGGPPAHLWGRGGHGGRGSHGVRGFPATWRLAVGPRAGQVEQAGQLGGPCPGGSALLPLPVRPPRCQHPTVLITAAAEKP